MSSSPATSAETMKPLRRALPGIARRYGYRAPLLFITLLVLAAFSTWMKWYSKPPAAPAQTATPGPDYYLRNFIITATGMDGLPRYVIEASYMAYMAGQKSVTFLRPKLLFHNEALSTWAITGEQANITEQGKQILMKGEVVLEQLPGSKGEALRVETTDLFVLPALKRAETAARVVMETDGAVIEATGFRINLAQGKLNFLRQTRGRYYAPSR